MPSALPDGDPAPPDGRLARTTLDAAYGVDFGAYVHVPFCTVRCGYCDFNTYTASELQGVSQGSYADTVLSEIRLSADLLTDGDTLYERIPPLTSIFFGGGTPTLLPAEHLGLIIRELRDVFGLDPDVEITTEANPETVTPGYFDALLEAGFTRVSLGMQSAVPRVLEVLDRTHRPGRPEEAVADAHAAGFAHVNLDLIYGSPLETDEDWQRSLEAAIGAEPDHISAYALVIEPGTALHRQVSSGVLPPTDDDVAADRYLMADDLLRAAGYDWYEVSNWSRGPDSECRHNELYWSDSNWWGYGPGAHSHVSGVRWWNVKHPSRYAAMLEHGGSPAAGRETPDLAARYLEKIMLRVRMRSGLATHEITEHARRSLPQLASWGLIEHDALRMDRVVLTQRGRLMADAVVRELAS